MRIVGWGRGNPARFKINQDPEPGWMGVLFCGNQSIDKGSVVEIFDGADLVALAEIDIESFEINAKYYCRGWFLRESFIGEKIKLFLEAKAR